MPWRSVETALLSGDCGVSPGKTRTIATETHSPEALEAVQSAARRNGFEHGMYRDLYVFWKSTPAKSAEFHHAGPGSTERTMTSIQSRSRAETSELSLGIVQEAPTQFDEPFYRYLAQETRFRFVVYYFGADEATARDDPEIGRRVGWDFAFNRGYAAVFSQRTKPSQFARRVVHAGHDLIIVSGYNQAHTVFTALLARVKGVPAGLRSDNVLPQDGGRGRHWPIKSLLFPPLFRLYTTGHPVGKLAGQYLMHFGFKRESLFCFPYAVDHQRFARESSSLRADLASLRASWGLPGRGQVVCGVMKFSEREDPLTLVRAFLMARKQFPDLSLLLVGDGPLRNKVEEAAADQLGRSILLPGYQAYGMLPAAYAASDLFVHTARGAWEVSVNEALACGLPVIASDAVGSAGELIVPKKLGYTFKHGDARELAERIVEVLSDSQLLTRARLEGIESLQEWDYPATAERLLSAIKFARQP